MSLKHQEYKDRNQQFLKEYAAQDWVNEIYGGVLYRVITPGKGVKPSPKSIVHVNYSGKLVNGKIFDSTKGKGRPAVLRLNELIDGWRRALREMPEGSRWEVVIPFNLGYGTRAAGAIKPYSTLIFDITLIRVE
ncbi:MAG: FKBP-type peptidyl-prolyl cis-trans isomerase [Rikenellaceae bacterium]